MKLNFILSVTTVLLVAITLPMEGRRVTMFPLSPREVYRVLREAGREDAIPEGRVITQGIAAVSGFALGLAKGIGGSLLVDLAVANGLFGSTNQQQEVQTQEVCFSSRSLNEIYDGEDEDVAEDRQAVAPTGEAATIPSGTGRQTPTVTSPTTPTLPPPPTYTATSPALTTTTSPTTTLTNAPTTTGTDTDTGAGTYVTNGDGTGTETGTTTQTGTGGSINCVVIQQPPSNTGNKAG